MVNEIIIINNKQEQLDFSAYSKIRILNKQENIYVNPAWNLGVKEAQSEYVAILNDDIFFKKEFLDKVHRFIENNQDWGLDGLVEFPPHQLIAKGAKHVDMSTRFVNKNFVGQVFDMKDFVNNKKYETDVDYPVFKGVFPSWDNSSRKAYSMAWVFEGLTPKLYKKWLKGCIKYTKKTKKENEQFVFINAWNEWAEGAHLEADLRYGYAYLQATKEVLEEE